MNGNPLRRGSMMLEFVLVMPIAFILVMMVLQFAHIWAARQVVKYASYCAARATLTANEVIAHDHARAAARQVCAWITFADSMTTNVNATTVTGVSIPGWGMIPGSSTVDERLDVRAGLYDSTNLAFPWATRATVEFKFPLLMPVVGEAIHRLMNESTEEDFPYLTLTETCVLPKPYSTTYYPMTSADLEGLW